MNPPPITYDDVPVILKRWYRDRSSDLSFNYVLFADLVTTATSASDAASETASASASVGATTTGVFNTDCYFQGTSYFLLLFVLVLPSSYSFSYSYPPIHPPTTYTYLPTHSKKLYYYTSIHPKTHPISTAHSTNTPHHQ